MLENFLTDTHAHIHSAPLVSDIEGVIERAAEAGVRRIITIGVDIADSRAAVNVAEKFEQIYATVGVHPHDSGRYNKKDCAAFAELARRNKVLAIGEIGLDFYKEYVERTIQESVFIEMLEISLDVAKPVVIHNRDTGTRCREVMSDVLGGKSNGGILHCFNGDRDIMKWALDNGFYISYAGQTTYKSAGDIRDTLKFVPADRIFIETDCPYLAPVPLRGKTNEPAYLIHTFRFVANELGLDMETFANRLEMNFNTLFADLEGKI